LIASEGRKRRELSVRQINERNAQKKIIQNRFVVKWILIFLGDDWTSPIHFELGGFSFVSVKFRTARENK